MEFQKKYKPQENKIFGQKYISNTEYKNLMRNAASVAHFKSALAIAEERERKRLEAEM